MSSSMWAPSNAQELDAARQTPRKTPFADQHAKARDQGFYAPDVASGSGSGRGRSKSGPGRARRPGGVDGVPMTPDRGSGRASARGKPRGGPNPHQQYHQEPMSMATTPIKQSASSSGYGRKTSKDREAIWQSIWGDDSDEEKPKEKVTQETEPIKEEEAVEAVVDGNGRENAGTTDTDVQRLGDKLANARLASKPAAVLAPTAAPPAVVIPPPAVISGVDWSELDDDEDLTFLEQVPVSANSSAQDSHNLENTEREAITTSSSTPSASTSAAFGDAKTQAALHPVHPLGLNVTTASDVADLSHEKPAKVNVGQKSSLTSPSPPSETKDAEPIVDVKLAPEVATPNSQREEAQTSEDLGSESEGVADSSRAGLKSPVESNNFTDGSSLKDSRWANAGARGTANQRGARGGARPPTRGSFQQGPPQRNQQYPSNPRPQMQNKPRPLNQNAPRAPPGQANRGPPTGPRAGATQPQQNQHRGSGSRNAPPLTGNQPPQQPHSAASSATSSDTSSPVPPSTASASSTAESPSSSNSTGPLSQQQQQRGPRQAPMQKDSVKRLMNGWINTAPGGMRRGPSGRGRGRAPAGGEQAGNAPNAGGDKQ
ncbi:hypothetical protein QFC21_005856 [Naganishia friedmannii]|uniref:Uncharacterized protein n=1 Tax=Naganishia friedmannii TaxID=89922 RepID=A0ACC2V6A8_9TREE|nr:hypothetical protein QFC21_005856 [Naganishia friedmannii]